MANEPTVVVVEDDDTPPPQDAAGVAAGAALVTSSAAAEAATDAQARAENAEAGAGVAIDAAGRAETAAYDAQADVASVRDQMAAGFAELRDLITGPAPDLVDDVDEVAPAPEPVAETEPAGGEGGDGQAERKPTRRRGGGNSRWFGSNHRR